MLIDKPGYYQQRDGKKAWVGCITPDGLFGLGVNDQNQTRRWRVDTGGIYPGVGEFVSDLVAPWPSDPEPLSRPEWAPPNPATWLCQTSTDERYIVMDRFWLEAWHRHVKTMSGYHDVKDFYEPPVVDWSKMPAWCNWVAMNKSGSWHVFKDKPLELDENDEQWYESTLKLYIPNGYTPDWHGDWKQSLVRRPK